MATKTAAQLKAFFQTGDQPSQDEFAHLIDTIQPDPVFIDGTADVNLTVADHAFRHVIIAGDIDNNTADRTYTLPTPALGTWFHIIYICFMNECRYVISSDWQITSGKVVYIAVCLYCSVFFPLADRYNKFVFIVYAVYLL